MTMLHLNKVLGGVLQAAQKLSQAQEPGWATNPNTLEKGLLHPCPAAYVLGRNKGNLADVTSVLADGV